MQLTNPAWVTHDGGAIYSIDIHPTADKLLTCGQGNDGGLGVVVVWNLLPIRKEQAYNEEEPKVLARLQHQAGVNCVRWSVDGQLFACASDDKVVTIYEYEGRVKSSGTIGRSEAGTVDKYRGSHTLHSHTMEVMSVEWSSDGRFLASSSMDNTVIVWNAKKLPERMVVLDCARGGHDGPVKGVAWDPIGKYLASQSADKSVRIWTTDNWQCETTVSEPFVDSGQTTMFSRLAWSADGQFLFAPCAMNNQGPVAQIIRRKDWDVSLDMVGHRKAVTSVRVSPRLINYRDNGKVIQVSCVAVGSRDKSVSVWVFPLVRRPVLVISRLFKHSIMDMSWNGLDLAICSQDGSIKYLSFTEKELGKILSLEEMGDACDTLYKVRPVQFQPTDDYCDLDTSRGGLNGTFIETPAQLLARNKKGEAAATSEAAPTVSSPAVAEAKRQAEIMAEKRKEQVETVTKEGRRRIQPVFISSTIADDVPAPSIAANPSTSKDSVSTVVKNATSKTIEAKQPKPPSKAVPPPPAKKTRVEVSTDDSTAPESSDDDSAMSTEDGAGGQTLADKQRPGASMMMNPNFKKPALRAIDRTRIVVTDASTVLEVPDQQATLEESVIGMPGDIVEVNNEWTCAGIRTSRLIYRKGEVVQWTAFIGPPVALLTANRHWCVLASYDRGMRVLCSSSGRLQWNLQLDSVAVRVGVSVHRVFALSQTGKFSSWDMEKGKCLLSRLSIADCVSQDSSLTSIAMTSSGMPLLGFSTGTLFTYSKDMLSWSLIDSATPLLRLSDCIDNEELGDGQLGKLLKRRRRVGPAPNVPLVVRQSVRQSQLEAWLSSAHSAGSSADYKRILMTYLQQLIKDRSLDKLRDVVSRFDGTGVVCGLQKAALRADAQQMIRNDPVTAHLLPELKTSLF